MAYPTRKDGIENLEKLYPEIAALSIELYNIVKSSLSELIESDLIVSKATRELDKIFNQAALDMDFSGKFQDKILETIALSSFTESISVDKMGAISYDEFKSRLPKIFAKGKEKTVNEVIRGRTTLALQEQREILNDAFKTGRTVRETAKDLKTIQEQYGRISKIATTQQIPETIINKRIFQSVATARENIKRFGYNDVTKEIGDVEQYLKKILTEHKSGRAVNPSLRGAYRRLLDAIDTDGKVLTDKSRKRRLSRIDNAIEQAMQAKSLQHATAVARTETMGNIAQAKIIKALDNPDTQYVRSVTSGANPCTYCLMMEDLGWQQVNQAVIPTFHTNCNCSVVFKRTLERPKRETEKSYDTMIIGHIDKSQKKHGRIYVNKTWRGVLPNPIDLRKAKFYTDYINEVK